MCNLMTSCIHLVGVASQTIFTSTFCSIAHLYVIASEFVCSRARARVCVCVCVCVSGVTLTSRFAACAYCVLAFHLFRHVLVVCVRVLCG